MKLLRAEFQNFRMLRDLELNFSSDPEKTIQSALERLRQRNRVMPGDPVVIVSDVAAGMERVTSIQVRAFG